MLLPIQPRTVKPKINTIANKIQSRFTLASCHPHPARSLPYPPGPRPGPASTCPRDTAASLPRFRVDLRRPRRPAWSDGQGLRQPFPRVQPGAVDPRLHLAHAEAQRLRHVGTRPALDVAHDQDSPIVRRHLLDGRAQGDAYFDTTGGVVDGGRPVDDGRGMPPAAVERRKHLVEAELEVLARSPAGLLEGAVGDDPIEPPSEGRLAPEGVDLAD